MSEEASTAPRRSALLVIDVQNGVVGGGYDRDGVVGRIRSLIDKAKAEDVPVIWIQHQDDEDLAPGTEKWQLVEEIRPGDGETVIPKRFNDSFAETPLRERLDDLGIGHLVVTGAASDWCVRATSTRALIDGYDLTLVQDAHTTGDAEFDLADGEVVPISAKQIVAHTNMSFCWLEYPGVKTAIASAEEIEFIR